MTTLWSTYLGFPSFELSDELDNAHDRSPFTGGGNRTHVTVPEDILTTEDLYHSSTGVFIEFDKYFDSQVV